MVLSKNPDKDKNSSSTWEMVKLGLVLALYAALSCMVLALVNNFTEPRIKSNQMKAAEKAMAEVFPDADEFVPFTDFSPLPDKTISVSDAFLAKKDGKVTGGVIQVSGPTYDKGRIILALGLDGRVRGMRFLELTDSQGFGSKAKDPFFRLKGGTTFYEQFTGKDAGQAFVLNKNFDGISGATITSSSVAKLMNVGSALLLDYFASHGLGGKNE